LLNQEDGAGKPLTKIRWEFFINMKDMFW